jgi:RecA-family ATPase
VKGYLVEGATILAGRPKIGKSWLALDWSVAVARGGFCFGDVRCKEGDVLYIALEDNKRRLKSRLAKILGLIGEWPEKLEYATEWPRANEGGLASIRA